eukprot:CAMPEP_0181289056 /NCGR_PEP_ID=MMETSP1101-20121128/678_1 /TAXON_ID=46948 /ORGANISM="Rhodomonas abbreviata, Strain Caron Lab Isolate" /LENGTH=419 /DNA_ID=CAMNT_0023393251 /DNA_START=228 /DNA_END=1487 /DNA_ORIENTATION=+
MTHENKRRDDRHRVVLDMETGDPDDLLTLILLARHPNVVLKAVTLTPGTREQVSLVQWVLRKLQVSCVKIGAQEWPKHADKEIGGLKTGGFYKNFGREQVIDQDISLASALLCEECDENTTLLTCGPLHNLGAAIEASNPPEDVDALQKLLQNIQEEMLSLQTSNRVEMLSLQTSIRVEGNAQTRARIGELKRLQKQTLVKLQAEHHRSTTSTQLQPFKVGRWVAQGGFASKRVVPEHCITLPQFAHLEVCRTWNFGGNISAAKAALHSKRIGRKVLVSKNVCHRVKYDKEWHTFLAKVLERIPAGTSNRAALELVHAAMTSYLEKRKGGKKMHDPLALSVLLDERVCYLKEVEMFERRGQWGCSMSPGSDTWISVDYDPLIFSSTLLGVPSTLATELLPAEWGARDSSEEGDNAKHGL